jgi:hypothetical protein
VKCHRTPHAGTVRADAHDAPVSASVAGEEQGGEATRLGDLRGADRAGVAVDHLSVQEWPCRIEGGGMRITAREAGGFTGDHQRPDGHPARLEGDGEVRGVFAQMTRDLQSRGGASDEHDGNSRSPAGIDEGDALIGESLPDAVFAASVVDADALDPCRAGRGGLVQENRLQAGEQASGRLAGCSSGVCDHVERSPAETRAQAAEQELHPGGIRLDAQSVVVAELQGVLVPPEQGRTRIETREDRRCERHPSDSGGTPVPAGCSRSIRGQLPRVPPTGEERC